MFYGLSDGFEKGEGDTTDTRVLFLIKDWEEITIGIRVFEGIDGGLPLNINGDLVPFLSFFFFSFLFFILFYVLLVF